MGVPDPQRYRRLRGQRYRRLRGQFYQRSYSPLVPPTSEGIILLSELRRGCSSSDVIVVVFVISVVSYFVLIATAVPFLVVAVSIVFIVVVVVVVVFIFDLSVVYIPAVATAGIVSIVSIFSPYR